jgi:hypothetical protein
MRISLLLLLISFVVQAEEVIEEVTTQVLTPTISDNLLPGLVEFTTSGDATMTGNTNFCDPGEACTGAQGGTYSTTIDVTDEMSIAEINAGFDLAYGVKVNSHPSNASLPTCDLTNGDCQDNFNLTLTLTENDEVRQTYEHEFVLNYSGLREYEFEQTVVSNSWVELSMLLELYGQDAGYPTGLYGPQFTDPWLTTSYNAISYITEQIVTIVQDDMDDVVDQILEEVMEEPEPEIVLEEPEPEVIAEPEPEIIIEIEPEPEPEVIAEPDETFVVDAEEIFSNPVLSEIVGTGDTVTVTLAEAGTGNIIDSFQVDVQSETVTTLPVVDASTTDTSSAPADDLAAMDGMESMGFEEQPEMSVTEAFEEMPEMEAEVAEVEMAEPEPAEVEIAESDPEPVETEMAEPDSEVAEVETAEAEEGSEMAEAEGSSEPESTGTEQERTEEPARVASGPDKKTAPEKKVSAKEKAKAKKQRLVKKISTRVMATLSQNYEAAMQGAALSVMRMSAPTYKSVELQDLEDWYLPVEFDGGTNYDHPASMWFSAQANQDMSELVKLQWRR